MQQLDWQGVFPAITTPFLDDALDRPRASRRSTSRGWPTTDAAASSRSDHSARRRRSAFDEKISILETCKRALGDRIPLIAGIAGLSTAECVALAKRAAARRVRRAHGACRRTSIAATGERARRISTR